MTLAVVVFLAAAGAAVWFLWLRDDQAASDPSSSPSSQSSPSADAVPSGSPTAAEETAPIVVAGSSGLLDHVQALTPLLPEVGAVDPIGQGAGAEAFSSGDAHVAMALPGLRDDQVDAGGACVPGTDVHQFLFTARLTHVVVNVPGLDAVNLDAPTLAAIYQGTITNWNDPAIAALNPSSTLPDLAITPLHRSDPNLTNSTVQQWLVAAGDGAWTAAEDDWEGTHGEDATSPIEVRQAVTSTEGALGYVDTFHAEGLTSANLMVDADAVSPGPENIEGHLQQARDAPSEPVTPVVPETYPLVDFGYLVACTEYEDPKAGTSVRNLITMALSSDGQFLLSERSGVEITPLDEERELAEGIS